MTRIRPCPLNLRLSVVAAAVACCFGSSAAIGNPVGPIVKHGQASFATQGKSLTVTNSPGSIINWQSFSIGTGETTRFVQQNASSAVLNRVVGSQGSSILGTLQSNGKVFLINPNGIIFGSGALIDTAGLVASTLNMMDADFLAGRLRFGNTPGAGAITNAGEIRTPLGGRVLLISPNGVENSGIIHAPQGEVILAAGKTVEIADSLDPEVRVELTAPAARAVNLGQIVADAGRVGIYGGIVANHGVVSANSAVVGENGKIVLKSAHDTQLVAGSVTSASGAQGGRVDIGATSGTTLVAGTVTATGSAATGGEVRVLGERVGLTNSARIDASGASGGGTVLIGGDLRGGNPDVQNAQMTYIAADARINADAITRGSGGKVIAWADDTLRSHGAISARGGAQSGDGGFVETSGKLGLHVTRGPDVRAPAGKAGTWLLDPNDIEIVAGQSFDATTNTGAPFFAPLTDTSVVGADLINAQLDFGSNVTINTTSRGATAGTQQGNITISAPLVKNAQTDPNGVFIGTTSLTLQAHNNIVIGSAGSITSNGDPLNVVLEGPTSGSSAAGSIAIGAPIATRGGSVVARATGPITSTAAINTLNAAGTFGSTVQFQSATGAITVGNTVNSGNFSMFGTGGVTINAPVSATSNATAQATAGKVTVAANVSSAGTVSLTGRDGVQLTSGTQVAAGIFGSFNATVSGASGSLDIDAGAGVSSRGASLRADSMEIQGVINAGVGSVTVRPNSAARGIVLGANTAGNLALTSTELGNIATTGQRFIGDSSTGPIVVNAPLNVTAGSRLEFESQSTYTQNAGASVTSTVPVVITAPTGVTLNAPLSGSNIEIGTNSLAPNATVTSGSNILVYPTAFGRPINLGVTTPGTTTFDLTAAQINNLVTAPGGTLFIGDTGSGALSIAGPIAPTGTSTLYLSSGTSVSQTGTGTISIANLALEAFGPVNLPQANMVGTLAASLCCSGDAFVFANAASAPLTIGAAGGITGVRNDSFSAANSGEISANNLTINSPLVFSGGTVTLKSVDAPRVDLGGADQAGVLGLGTTDLSNVSASRLLVKSDQTDITAAIAPGVTTLQLVPRTAARTINIVGGAKNAANLEFTPGDIANVTVNTLALGDTASGAVNVDTALGVPNTIQNFVLNSAEAGTGVAVNAAITADRSVQINADNATLVASVTSTSGNVGVAPLTANRAMDLGNKTAGKLSISEAEIETRLSAASGAISFGSTTTGNIDVTAPLNITASSAVTLSTNNTGIITVPISGPSLAATGTLNLNAGRITLGTGGNISGTVDVNLNADRMDIGASVSAPNGRINVAPRTPRGVVLGPDDSASALGFTPTELANFMPMDTLQIGNTSTTSSITISPTVPPPGNPPTIISATNASTLRLVTSGAVSQSAQTVLQSPSLAVQAGSGITLDQNNDIDTVAATTSFGNINITYSGSNPLNVGLVDGLNGVSITSFFSGGNIRLRSDEINLNAPVSISTANRSVTLVPLNSNRTMDLGTKVGGAFSLTETELNRISATTLAIGDVSTSNITVTQPIALTGVTNVNVNTGPSATVAVNNAFTAPGSITFNTGTLTNSGTITSTTGSITGVADVTGIGANITSGPTGAITLRPLSNALPIAVGAADSPGTLYGIDSAELGRLIHGSGGLTIGSTSSGDMSVTHAGALTGNVSLITGGLATFGSNTFSAGGTLNVTANTMSIPGVAGISGGTGVNITTATPGRNVTLGTKPNSGTALELDAGELAKISTGAGGTLTVDTSGTLTTTAALPFTAVTNLAFGGSTFTHTGGTLAAQGDITLRGNTMTLGSAVGSTNNGRITVAPRQFRSMNLGTNPAGGALGLTNTEIGMLSTGGVVQLGDLATTSSMTVTQSITQPAGSAALALVSSGAVSQSPGATITATNLKVQSNSSVNLSENNIVGTLAGSSSGTFAFTGTGTLTIGAVDFSTGVSDGTVTLRADSLNIAESISASTTNLAPRTTGAAIDLGSDTGFGLTDLEIDRVGSFTLNIGNGTSGAITVSAPIDRAFGTINLNPQAGSTINVNAALGSANMSTITMNSGLNGTVNIAAPVLSSSNISATGNNITVNGSITSNNGSVTLGAAAGATSSTITVNQPVMARNNVTFTADNQNINAAITSRFSTVSLAPRTNVPISVGADTTGALNISTTELALISADQVSIGSSTAGALTITAPIGPFAFDALSLTSGGDVTQTTGSTITVSNQNPNNSNLLTGSLSVNSGGKILLPEPNNIAVSVSGSASGVAQDFQFNNISPLKLQNVTGVFASRNVIIEAPPGSLVLSNNGAADKAAGEVVTPVLKAQETQQDADEDSKKRKDDKAKKEEEEDKKAGKEKKACS